MRLWSLKMFAGKACLHSSTHQRYKALGRQVWNYVLDHSSMFNSSIHILFIYLNHGRLSRNVTG